MLKESEKRRTHCETDYAMRHYYKLTPREVGLQKGKRIAIFVGVKPGAFNLGVHGFDATIYVHSTA